MTRASFRSSSSGRRRTRPGVSPAAGGSSGGRSSVGSGFTLVEMLVAVALVLLMMSLFAQVFQSATKSMSQQKGMAENDQKARQLLLLIRGDLKNRTYVDVKPFGFVVDDSANPGPTWQGGGLRKGYFSISEGDPDSNIDDVLQLTVELPVGEYFAGRTALLKAPGDTVTQVNPADQSTWTVDLGSTSSTTETISLRDYLTGNYTSPNLAIRRQPEFDDGIRDPNRVGRSQDAEVCYFLRNGNLYRRVLLIRNQYETTGGTASMNENPTGFTGDYSSNVVAVGSGYFWRDFDYSAYHRGYDYDSTTMVWTSRGMYFHTSDSLINTTQPGNPTVVGARVSLGWPLFRFGSTVYLGDRITPNVPGHPREYLVAGDPSAFFGRPTAREMAHSAFGYPGTIPLNAHPLDPAYNTLTLDANTGLIGAYSATNAVTDPTSTSRRGEDIVLTNVHSFDIQVYDDHSAVQSFVQLGNSSGQGYYSSAARTGTVNRYDTWNPTIPSSNPPPYRPINDGSDAANPVTDGKPGVANFDDNNDGTPDDAGEAGWLGSDDEVSLKAILITIRYLDVSSGQMRQLSIVESLRQ